MTIFLIVIVTLLIFIAWGRIDAYRWYQHGVDTKARIEQIQQDVHDPRVDYLIRYSFLLNGAPEGSAVYQGTCTCSSLTYPDAMMLKEGDLITIQYDKRYPERNRLKKEDA
jgi:hypothetical protein